MYLDISGVFCGPVEGPNHAAPGECYYYQNFDRYKIGIRLHLYTILRTSPGSVSLKKDELTDKQRLLSSWFCSSLQQSDKSSDSCTVSTDTSSSY
jgi:hypothetical protein